MYINIYIYIFRNAGTRYIHLLLRLFFGVYWFIKQEVLQGITTLRLTKLDVADKKNWLQPKDIHSGIGAESVLKVVWYSRKIS